MRPKQHKAQRIGAEILTTLPLTPATRNEIRRSC
jgi:hypothetical protein